MFESCRDRHLERPTIKGFLAVSAFVLWPLSCCKALQLSFSEFNELPGITIHSTQHGRNTTVRFPFSDHLPGRRASPHHRLDEWLDEFRIGQCLLGLRDLR